MDNRIPSTIRKAASIDFAGINVISDSVPGIAVTRCTLAFNTYADTFLGLFFVNTFSRGGRATVYGTLPRINCTNM